MKALTALYFLCMVLIAGCKKDSPDDQATHDNNLTAKINTWLNSLQHTGTVERNQKVQLLQQYLDYDRAYFEDLNNGERFIIVPVKAGFKTINNKNKNPLNNLVLILDKTGNIRSGKIMQFVPGSGTAPAQLPRNTMHDIYNSQPVAVNGSFTAITVWDQYLYRLDYKDGQLSKSATMQPKDGPAQARGCTDWYIVTTIYINGEIFDQSYEYIGTTCDGCTPMDPNLESLGCDGNGEIPGGPPVAEPELMSKQVLWTVKANTTLGWEVKSYEQLNGIRPAWPVLSYFTSIVHLNDAAFNVYQPSFPGYTTWQRLAVTTNITPGGGAASATVSGKIYNSVQGDLAISNAQPWTAVTEFPQ